MRSLILLIMTFGLFVITAYAEFKSPEQVSKWMTHYYEHPAPGEVFSSLKYMSDTDMLAYKKSYAPTFGFLAGIFKNNPKESKELLNKLKTLKKFPAEILIQGIWYANLPDSEKTALAILEKHPDLKSKFNFMYKEKPVSVEDIPFSKAPWVVDALWGDFMATGNEKPVSRIISALKWSDEKHDDNDIDKLVIGVAAKWSLVSYSINHKKVLEICKSELKKQPENVKSKLMEVVNLAEEEIKVRKNIKSPHKK